MKRSQFLSGDRSRLHKYLTHAAVGAVAAFTIASTLATSASAEAIKLQMVGSWAPGVSRDADIAIRFMDEVNKHGEGKVEIIYKGCEGSGADI